MTWPAPTRQAHEAFCTTEGWQQVRNARGQAVSHHVTYELQLHDGRIRRTRISHPVNRETYGPSIWSHILQEQLDVDQATFLACVQEGRQPDRGKPEPVSEAEVAAMSREEAIARMHQYWTAGS